MAITNAPVQGVYRIANAARLSSAVDIGYISTSNMAPVFLCTDGDANNEKFYLRRVVSEASGTGDVFEVYALHCGKLVTKVHPDESWGANVVQYARQGSDIQRWRPIPSGTTTLNGATVYMQKVCNLATTKVLATNGDKTADVTDIMCGTWSNIPARKWVFVRDSFHDATLAAPSSFGLSATAPSAKKQKGGRLKRIAIAESTTFYAYFTGVKGSGVQLRYRSRYMNSSLKWAGWSNWSAVNVSVADGRYEDIGWRNAWSYYACTRTPNTKEVEHYADAVGGFAITAPTTTYLRKEYQFEIRNVQTASPKAKSACGISMLAHGNSLVQSVIVDKTPALTISGLAMTAGGLAVNYTSTAVCDGNSVTVSSVKIDGAELLTAKHVEKGADAVGSLVIPMDKLRFIPEAGKAATARASITSRFGVKSATATATKSITWGSRGITLTVTQAARSTSAHGKTETADHSVAVTLAATKDGSSIAPTHENSVVLCAWERDGETVTMAAEPRDADARWEVYPPLNTSWTLMAYIEEDGSWGSSNPAGLPVSSDAHVINPRTFDEYDSAHLDIGMFAEVGHTSRSMSNDVSTWKCLGATLDAGAAADASSGEIRLTCVIPGESTSYESIEDLRRMVDAASCIYRTPDGGVHHVIIESASWDRIDAGNWYECDITMREVE